MPTRNDYLIKLSNELFSTQFLGFTPTSNSTKPPHIANGLFRECIGEYWDTEMIHKWIVSEQKENATSSEEIVSEFKSILARKDLENINNIKKLRFLLNEIFNPDNTVYPKYDFSSYNITTHWLIHKSVAPEAKIGRFIFDILAKQIDGKRSPAIELINKALKEENDDLSNLIRPILAFPSLDTKKHDNEVRYASEDEITWDSCKQTIRDGFDNLANNLIAVGEDKNSLTVLQRMVNYSCFATYYYLVQSDAAIYNKERIPMVFDAGLDLESIKKSSEKSFIFAKNAVEDFFIDSIMKILKNEEQLADSDRDCQRFIEDMCFSTIDREEDIKPSIKSFYLSFIKDGSSPIHSLAKALQLVLYTCEYKSNSPSDFCRVLGVRCGLIAPKGNRAKVKRYLFDSFILETLTLSIMSQDDIKYGIEFKELGEKFTKFYNILLGTDAHTEYSILQKSNISQSTPGDLRGDLSLNAQSIAEMYLSLGLGHKYADGVTIIKWR